MEPENHLIEKGNHLPNLHDFGFKMLIFRSGINEVSDFKTFWVVSGDISVWYTSCFMLLNKNAKDASLCGSKPLGFDTILSIKVVGGRASAKIQPKMVKYLKDKTEMKAFQAVFKTLVTFHYAGLSMKIH